MSIKMGMRHIKTEISVTGSLLLNYLLKYDVFCCSNYYFGLIPNSNEWHMNLLTSALSRCTYIFPFSKFCCYYFIL